ncbi:glycine betaine ABC transporter substrate-binding protein [Gelria sp. Kuro-4]|uniref:glycine betaine ABC transporter substrate-binding protein n=1 Tax=Gelria sp. Kuro-4 TaxID=2796927 RepID=UPI001C7FB2CF
MIVVRNLYKIFGPRPQSVFPLLEQGLGKEKILVETGHTVGINNASFAVRRGEIFVVMGLSGSGKSTLIRCLNRLIEPTRGKVLVEGRDITALDTAELRQLRREKLAMVFQRFGLFPHRTVLGNVEYGLEVQGIPAPKRREKARQALELVGLTGWEAAYPSALSGGMQQRVGLARALATEPEVLLMDEAFSALDPLIRKQMQDELLNLQSQVKKTIVFITHDLAGAGIMKATAKAIQDYGLKLKLVEGSEPAMTAALKKAIDNKEWIVVTGWAPHWKFARWDLKFLEDPKKDYGEVENIHITARKGLAEDMPEVADFLKNFKLNAQQLGDLEGRIADGEEPPAAAKAWMAENKDVVDSWWK